MPTQLGVPADRPLFTVAARTFAWADVVLAAELRGELGELERQAAQGLACVRRSAATGAPLTPDALRAAATVFRYEHDLLAAEELEAWLESRGVTLPDWTGYLQRLLLRERWAEQLEQTEADFPVGEDEVVAAMPAEAVCSGFLRVAAERLAEDAALATADDVAASVEELIREADAVRARPPSSAELEREVASHRLDWIRIEAETLELADAEAAREAALCVRVDGRPLTEVADDCGVPASPLTMYLGDADPQLRTALISASPGELIGPVERGDRHLLLQLHAKAEPSPGDPELERRAAAVLARRTVERALRDRVVWHQRP